MSRPISQEEVVTYADALIIQYIEKKGIPKLPQQLASLKIRDSESIGPLPTTSKEHKFDTVLENIIYQHLARAFDDGEVDACSPTITIQKGKSIPAMRSTQRQSFGCVSSLSLLDVVESPKSTNPPSKRLTPKRPTTNDVSKTPKNDKDTLSSPDRRMNVSKTPKNDEDTLSSADRRMSCKTSPFVRRRRSRCRRDERPNTAPPGVFLTAAHSTSRSRKSRSKESWIPDQIREKMVLRDLSVVTRNLEFNDMYQRSFSFASDGGADELDGMSPFQQNLTKEKFGLASRKARGLCCRHFLPINLIMAVPLKAVFDMRDTWGAKFDPEGQKSRAVNVNPNLKRAPMCYDKTRVCAFCSQLFHGEQEVYRPSFETKEAERELNNAVERERMHAIMSDPLKRMDDERSHEILNDDMPL